METQTHTQLPTSPEQYLHEAYVGSKQVSEEMLYSLPLVLYTLLAEDMDDRQERINILENICKNHESYLAPFKLPIAEVASIYLECKSLIHYHQTLIDLMKDKANQIFIQTNLSEKYRLPWLEQYIYMKSLRDLDIAHYIAFTEGYWYYCTHRKDKPQPEASLVIVQVGNFLGNLYSENIFEFGKALFFGESMRLHYTKQINDNECVNIHNFDLAFRNQCFDEYIRLRTQEIAETMNKDNDRLYPPTEKDYLCTLLDTEECAVNRENGLEQFRGSLGYEHEWFAGRPDVLKLANYFILYLKDKIENSKMPASVVYKAYNYYDNAQHIDNSRNLIVEQK